MNSRAQLSFLGTILASISPRFFLHEASARPERLSPGSFHVNGDGVVVLGLGVWEIAKLPSPSRDSGPVMRFCGAFCSAVVAARS